MRARALRPLVGFPRFLFLCFALSLMLAVSAAAAAACGALSARWTAGATSAVIVVPDPDAPASSADRAAPSRTRIEAVLALAGPGAHALDRAAIASLLADWTGGTGVTALDPTVLPALVTAGAGTSADRFAAAMAAAAPGSVVQSGADATGSALRRVGHGLVGAAILLLVLAGLGTVAALVAGNRRTLAGPGRAAIALLHELGCPDRALAGEVALRRTVAASLATLGVGVPVAVALVLHPAWRGVLVPALAALLPVPPLACGASYAAIMSHVSRMA